MVCLVDHCVLMLTLQYTVTGGYALYVDSILTNTTEILQFFVPVTNLPIFWFFFSHLLPRQNLHSFHFFMIYVKSTIWLACGFYKICSFWLTWWFCSTSFVFFTTRFNPGHYSNYLWKCSHLCLCAILLCLISRWPDQYLWMIITLIDLRETKYPQ